MQILVIIMLHDRVLRYEVFCVLNADLISSLCGHLMFAVFCGHTQPTNWSLISLAEQLQLSVMLLTDSLLNITDGTDQLVSLQCWICVVLLRMELAVEGRAGQAGLKCFLVTL